VRRRAVLAVLVFCVAAGAASSADAALTPKQYKAKLQAIAAESNKSQSVIGQGLGSKKMPALLVALGQFAKLEDHLGNEVSALSPPANAVAPNKQLAKGLHDIASAVRGVVVKLKGVTSITKATAILNKDTNGTKAGAEVDDALTKLRKLGYAS
jgi:hypothetical protein